MNDMVSSTWIHVVLVFLLKNIRTRLYVMRVKFIFKNERKLQERFFIDALDQSPDNSKSYNFLYLCKK